MAGALQDPFLELHDGTGALVATNDNWRSTQIGGLLTSDQSVDIQASALAPVNDAEAAIIVTLSPGAYTAVIRSVNNATGISLVEGYDLDPDKTSKLANISTRGFVQTGDNVMIGGFILGGGTGASSVVVRGIAPSLGTFGITNPLLDPMLELHNANGAIIDSNDDWRTNQALIQSTGLQPANDAESALLFSNPAPGGYTAIFAARTAERTSEWSRFTPFSNGRNAVVLVNPGAGTTPGTRHAMGLSLDPIVALSVSRHTVPW